ncbi:glycoside hydrolase family 3 C-terminal domain-containing protein [Occallatibacter savannae]|uniref:glycoside hydrolase family 3 C-terminal domain-containing protein n=1 Tax=Occallatibacter savannae TaxID=1002691 RepID=UPI000D69C725|nr:glycoside hydrolase family 3 C-terminal domain-containing protein [Occallatibacter savannae]
MRSVLRGCVFGVVGIGLAAAGFAGRAVAQADYPFRDTSLSDDARIDDLLKRVTLDEKVLLMSDHPKIPRLGIVFSGQVEGLHGLALGGPANWAARGRQPAGTTTFPQEKGLGATWDPELLKKVAALEGEEARYFYQNPVWDRGGVVVRAPNADLSRDPRWGRTEESYGEDPYLVGTLTVAFAQGLQGPDPKHWQAASLMKHFMANENENGRTHTSSDFDERLFREYYSVPFRMGFEQGGSRAVMASYNAWNGTPMTVNPVLKNVMVKEWGNDGLICTDGGALTLLTTAHKAFPDKEHGSAAAVKAGINHFLDTYIPDLTKALKDGLLTEADMDASLRNLLRVYLRLGEFDPAGADPYGKVGRETGGEVPPWERESSMSLVRQTTDESIVLLKNENNTLPLDRKNLKTIALIGPWIDTVLQDWYSGTFPYAVSILDGVREKASSNVLVLFADGSDENEAAALAKRADVAIVVVGNHPVCNAGWDQCATPSNGKEDVDRKTIVLEQEELVKKIFAANPKTVEVLRSSFPYSIVWSQGNVPAIVHMVHNSQEEGHGLADVLFGDYSPAGRLTQTWPTGDAQLKPILDYNLLDGETYLYSKEKPLYAFGYGLSYTTFEYRSVGASAARMEPDGSVKVHIKVKNTGKRPSDEVVQMYVQHLGSAVTRPQLELKGFRRVRIESGAEKDVALQLNARDLAYWDTAAHAWRVEKEKVRILAGGSSDKLPVQTTVDVIDAKEFRP